MTKKLLSLLLALLLSLSAVPLPARAEPAETAEEGPPAEAPMAVTFHAPEVTEQRDGPGAEAEGLITTDPMYFNYVNLSGAGAAQISDWVFGEYLGAQEGIGDEHGMDAAFLKTRLMVRAMNLNAWDYEEAIEYFIPVSDSGSRHELTLYGYEELEPEEIELLGVQPMGSIEKHVYGDVDSEGYDGRVFWYTVPIFVPSNDTALDIHVRGEPFAVIPLTHISGQTPYALVSTMQVFDYEEGADDTILSMTLRYSGFRLPDDPSAYLYTWSEWIEGEDEEEEIVHEYSASEVSEPDENGYRLLRFEFGDGVNGSAMIWGDLYFTDRGNYPQYFFDKATHLSHDGDGALRYDANGRPYFRTDYGDFEGAPFGTNVSVPTPYYCIFKAPDTGEAPEVMPTLSGDYYNAELGMSRTYLPHIWFTIFPGSYAGGEVVFSDDIGGTGYERYVTYEGQKQMVYLRKNATPEYGVKRIWATFYKEGLRTVKVGPYLVDYIPEKAPTPTNPGCVDPATGQEIGRTEGGVTVSGAAETLYRFYVSGVQGCGMYLSFCYTDTGNGNVYPTDSLRKMAWNAGTGRYELDVTRGQIPPDAELMRFQILHDDEGGLGGYKEASEPLDLPLYNPEPGFRLDIDNVTEETVYDTVGAILYPKAYRGGTVAVSLDGGKRFGAELAPEDESWPAVYFALPAPGDYDVYLRFSKSGLNPFVAGPRHVYYNDGSPAAPSDAGVELDGERVRQKNGAWLLSGAEDAAFTFFALAEAGLSLEAIFRDAEGAELFTRDLNRVGQRYAVNVPLSELHDAATVSFRVKAGEDGKPGRPRTLDLRVIYLKALYAPTVPYALHQDADGTSFFAVAPGASFSGVFEAPTLQGLSQRVTLSYQTASGANKTAQGTVEGDALGQYTVRLSLPANAARLNSIHYALLEDGETLAQLSYPLTGWRVWAMTKVTGIPKAYADAGAAFRLTGGDVDVSAVLTADNYAALELGDIPTGRYTYEITGRSGHILGGTADISRGKDLALSDCPELGTLTVKSAGEAVSATVRASLVTPDGETHSATGAVGAKLYDLPVGTRVTVTLDYDASAYPEVIGYSPASRSVTISGNKTASFTFQKASFCTLSGKLVRADRSRYQHVYYTDVSVEQTILRNGQAETYRATVRTDFYGNFSGLTVYDGVEATLSVRHVSYQLVEPCVFTPDGDTDLGELELDFSTELVVPVRLILVSPEHVHADKNGYLYRTEDDNSRNSGLSEVVAESAILPITRIYKSEGGSNATLLPDRDFDVLTVGGNKVLRFHAGTVGPGASLRSAISAMSFEYGGKTYAMGYTDKQITLDENGNAVLEIRAAQIGGEVRATVAPEGSGLIGFLCLRSYDGDGGGWRYVYGTGELSIPYGAAEMQQVKDHKGLSAYSLTVRPEELDDLLDHFNSGGGPGGVNSCLSGWLRLQNSCIVHLDNMTPAKPVGAEIFGAYRFVYQTALSERKGYVRVTATIEKRYPEAPDENVIDYIEVFSGSEMYGKSWFDYTMNGQEIGAEQAVADKRWDDTIWHNTKDEDGYFRPTLRLSFRCEVPMDSVNRINVTLKLHTRTLSGKDAGGGPVYSGYAQQYLGVSETVNLFDLSVPDTLYIKEEQESQGRQNWTATLSLRTYISDDPKENLITIWDNGTAIDSFTASHSRYTSTVFVRSVSLTDNRQPGLHTLWASRPVFNEERGEYETLISYSQCLPVLMGNEHDKAVHVTNIRWTHWNHRTSWDPNEPEYMFFANAAALEGKEIWIWPDKRSDMSFDVQYADSRQLAGVNFVYETQVLHEGWDWWDNMGNHGNKWLRYWTTETITIPCQWRGDFVRADGTVYSHWSFDNKYLGYVVGFSWQFVYKAGVDTSDEIDVADRVEAELEALYEANGLGEVPDDRALAEQIHAASGDTLTQLLQEDGDLLPDMFWDLKPRVQEESGDHIVVTAPDTAEVEGFRIEMREGELISGAQNLNEQIYKLMETERERGSQDPTEKPEDGWRVYWAKTDSLQGTTLIRMAVREVQEADGRWHYSYHRRVYLPVRVAEALTGETLLRDAELMDAHDEFIGRADRGKKVYDTFNDYFTYTDLGNTMYVNQMEKEMRIFMGSAEAGEKWGKQCSLISDRAGKTMAILGVADAAYTYYKGPDGKDGSGLRQLLEHVQDEKFRRSIENQIRDYEEMRQAIFNQDMTMKTVSSASNFTSINIVGKLAVFLGGLGNSWFSDQAKQFNQQVYDTTLLDIQRQLRFEKAKASRPAAEKWLRDKMDSIYGKGNWSEYALEEERKLWVLVTDEDGSVHYVWHEKAGNYNAVWDPAGFVFEAVEDKRLENVTATLYFTETVNEAGEPVDFAVWNDASGAQRNPSWTNSDGAYQWMVPEGWWKVRYEKDGYLIAESRPMRVPPIHTAVNIGLLSTEAPTARVSVGEGEITVLFSKYMQLESLIRLFGGESYRDERFDASAFTVQFYDAAGRAIPGTVSFPDKAANTGYKGDGYGRDIIASDWFVRTAVFTPADPETDLTGVRWQLADGMVSYSGVALDKKGAPENLYRVSLDPDGGALRESAALTQPDGRLRSLPDPVREGYVFDGWYTAAGERVDADRVFTADTALRARWTSPTDMDYAEDLSSLLVRNPEGKAKTCVIAYYDAQNRLLRTQIQPVSAGETALPLSPDGARYAKSFLLDQKQAPVCREESCYF
ncbi:MAG: InlB B-repeat-containing protein [Oscillospiraceae bacterium]|nr:InlB B-repeat-containing protein [Oscillospiraceae bacterium]